MQIFLNGQELDLNTGEKITITKQINDLADLSKANTSFTNSFKVPKTANNVRIMGMLGVAGNQSRVPYSLNDVTIIENSLVIIANGYAEITDTDDKSYNLNIYGSEKTFFEKLKMFTLQDVYPDTNVTWSAINLKNYCTNTTNWTFPIMQYCHQTIHSGSLQNSTGGAVFTRTPAIYSTPQFFVKYLFERVFAYLGYQVSYPMSTDTAFTKLMIPPQKGVSHFNVQHGDLFNLRNCVRIDVACDVFVKEIMFRFGLIIKVDEFNKKIEFKKLDTLLKSGTVVDWSDKFSGFKNEKYQMGNYGQTNYFKYADDDEPDERYPTLSPANQLIGSFDIANDALEPNYNVLESRMKKPKYWGFTETNDYAKGRIFFWNATSANTINFLFDVAENVASGNNNELKIKEIPFQLMYLRNLGKLINFSFVKPDDSMETAVQVQGRTCSMDGIDFQTYLDTNYIEITNMLNNVNIVKGVFNLSTLDFHNFDFFSRVYLEQFGSYFYVNKITNWQRNKLVEVELVKIPPIVSGGGGYGYSNNNMIGTL